MNRFNRGMTIISLVITIIVLFIITGVTIGMITNKNNGIIVNTEKSKETLEKETLIQKIQSDLFIEKTKKGRNLTQTEKENIIDNYGTITEEEEGIKVLNTTEGNYEILLSEIIL